MTTEAGKRLLKEWGPTDDPEYPQVGKYVDYRADFSGQIAAIEAEARATLLAELTAAVLGCHPGRFEVGWKAAVLTILANAGTTPAAKP